jgi:hypothetical protein
MADRFERRRLRVYVAGPISSDPMLGVARATAISRDIFLDGMAPFVPHWDAFWFLGEGHWKEYLEFDLEFVSVCDAVYRLGGESKGADKECAVAEHLGIPVFYEDTYQPWDSEPTKPGYLDMLSYAEKLNLTGVQRADIATA